MKSFELVDLLAELRREERPYLEFLREESLSVGLYVLSAGAVDRQTPHSEDEVYFVTEGRGVINISGQDREVKAGSVIFVPKGEEHFFHLITEDLTILVFFAPPEGAGPER